MEFYTFDTPFGPVAAGEEEGALVRLWLPGQPSPRIMSHSTPLLERTARQLLEYFAGERQSFDLPLRMEGTEFQKKVWRALLAVPYGQTASYGQLAQAVGCPGGARAVGMANHHNPLPILVPCHRIVGARGQLTGYAGGLELKRALLALERGKNPL